MSLPGIQGRIGIRPGRLILLLVGFLGVRVWLRLLTPCDVGERAALAALPQYGDMEVGQELVVGGYGLGDWLYSSLAPGGWGQGCSVPYEPPGPQDEVLPYYQRQLSEHGWNVKPVHGGPEVGENSSTQYLNAYREGYRYRIMSDRAVGGTDPPCT
jgi:hypothetical protein